ncbi:MAG: hypothetical protein KDI03_06675 [Anaerolineae bacterium]|nr:hypothetical protein [Anaerolineae bacterium]MCB0199743.1 hypothetical protein [Anaerolineae bacterium]MCB0204323.1 hypothetical protein [Anaerolineae bacterium]MCB0253754.1 hypothetical protein [Anaerolineae bacterium]
MAQILPTLLTFALCVILLYWLQRWITQHVQGIGLLLFNNADYGMALLWLVLLPGILLHEGSHWITAKVLGLKTGKFSFTPNTVKGQIVLGSVEVQRSNAFKDSLVGLAPFLAGTLALLILGYAVFDVGALGRAWEDNAWQRMFNLLVGTLRVDDAFLWLYLVFAISNAMMPSPSDRESWRLVLIYVGVVFLLLLVFGWLPTLSDALVQQLDAGLRMLTWAFGLALVVDAVLAVVLALLELLASALLRRKVVYK